MCHISLSSHTHIFYQRLNALKARIQEARIKSPLFDAKRYATDMEKLFRKMWDRYEKGLPAEHILS